MVDRPHPADAARGAGMNRPPTEESAGGSFAMRLQDNVAIVTGAARGIGEAIAVRFAAEGASIVVADIADEEGRATADRIRDFGGNAVYIHADVSVASDVEAMVAETVRVYGRLTTLVNNAAYGHWGGKAANELEESEWDRVHGVTLKGVFLCSKYALPAIVEAGGGSIVNIASITGIQGFAEDTAYASAKGGVLQLTKVLAIDYAPQRVRANAVSPGWTATPMNAQMRSDPKYMEIALRGPLIKRPAEPEEIAVVVAFLASDEAAYITGANVVVDGGWTVRNALGID